MRPESTEQVMERLKLDARRSALFHGLWSAARLLLFALVACQEGIPGVLRILAVVLVVWTLIEIPFSAVALRQRMKEIEAGEEVEARKY